MIEFIILLIILDWASKHSSLKELSFGGWLFLIAVVGVLVALFVSDAGL